MVDCAAGAVRCACSADAGRRGQKVHSASRTGAFGPWRSCAARRVQMIVPVVESAISCAGAVGGSSLMASSLMA